MPTLPPPLKKKDDNKQFQNRVHPRWASKKATARFTIFASPSFLENRKPTLLSKTQLPLRVCGKPFGENDRNDRGIISGFHQKNDFDPCFAGQCQYHTEKRDFHFLCSNNLFLFGAQSSEAFMFLEYGI
jgi:hypothetical protein